MLIGQLPLVSGKLDPAIPMPDDHQAVRSALRSGQLLSGELREAPVDTVAMPGEFEQIISTKLLAALPEQHTRGLTAELIQYASKLDGMILTGYAVDPHDDNGVSAFAERWLVILDCEPGYILHAHNQHGKFSLPIQPGQIIAFDDCLEHSVTFPDPERIDINRPCFFYTLPDPRYLKAGLENAR